jgi:hypothetical protein
VRTFAPRKSRAQLARHGVRLDGITSGERKDLIDGVRQRMHAVGAELNAIDSKAVCQSAEQMLTSATMLVKPPRCPRRLCRCRRWSEGRGGR